MTRSRTLLVALLLTVASHVNTRLAAARSTPSGHPDSWADDSVRIYIQPLPKLFDPHERTHKCDERRAKNTLASARASRKAAFSYICPDSPVTGIREQGGAELSDVHFWLEMRNSSLVVDHVEDANFVYVPISQNILERCVGKHGEARRRMNKNKFFGDAAQLRAMLPHLGKLPHFFAVKSFNFDNKAHAVGQEKKAAALDGIMDTLEQFGFIVKEPASLEILRPGLAENYVVVPQVSMWDPDVPLTTLTGRASLVDPRPHMFNAAFQTRSRYTVKGMVRRQLHNECASAGGRCEMFELMHNTISREVALGRSFMDARLCLQPPGDTPYRSSFFDCLGGGAIPVFVSPQDNVRPSFPYQHFPEINGEEYLLYARFNLTQQNIRTLLPRELENLTGGVSYEEAPRESGPGPTPYLDFIERHLTGPQGGERLTRAALALERDRKFYLYSRNPDHDIIRLSTLGRATPQDDAFTLGLKSVLAKALAAFQRTARRG